MKNKKLPIFTSSYGNIGKSILELKYKGEIKDDEPVSIFDIAKKHGLNSVYILDSYMGGYIQAFENSQKSDIQLNYGSEINICHNKETPDAAFGKYNLFAKNLEGYYELIELNSLWARKNAGEKTKEPLFFDEVKDLFKSDNLLLLVPFYDSFLHYNAFNFNGFIPDLSGLNPIFCIEDHETILDDTLQKLVKKYCKEYDYSIKETHKIYYYREEDFPAYLNFRAINRRGSWFKPELPHFSSNKFSFESFLNG